MPDDAQSVGLWDALKAVPGKVEGGLEGLWNHLKTTGDPEAAAAAEASKAMEPATTDFASRAVSGFGKSVARTAELGKIVGQLPLEVGKQLYEAGPGTIGKLRSGELQPGTPEAAEAARGTALAYGFIGTPGGTVGSGWSARFTDAELKKMLPDAIEGGVLPKGSTVEDLKGAMDAMATSRQAPRGSTETMWRPDAEAMEIGQQHGIPTSGITREEFFEHYARALHRQGSPGQIPLLNEENEAAFLAAQKRLGMTFEDELRKARASRPLEGEAGEAGGGGAGAGPPAAQEPPPMEPPRAGPPVMAEGGAVGPPEPPIEPPKMAGESGPARPSGAAPPEAWTEPTIDMPKGDVGETREMRQMRVGAMNRTQEALFRLHTNATADRIEFNQRYKQHLMGEDRLSPAQNYSIERLVEEPDYPHQLDPQTQRVYDEVIKPAAKEADEDFKFLKGQNAIPEDSLDYEGYLHRIVVSPRRPEGDQPFAPFAGVKSLRQQTSSMKKRQSFVAQGPDGQRMFIKKPPPAPYGTKMKDNTGREWEVRRATMQEVEANTDIRYLHDPVLATLQNGMQLKIARRNVEVLRRDVIPDLIDKGLAVTKPADAKRLGFEESIVPALRGTYFEPRMARAFDDFYKTPSLIQSDMGHSLGIFGAINRFAINSMFLNPVGHMRNVAYDYALGRGGLWFSPPAYMAQARSMREAFGDVWNKTPFYLQVLREGGALMGADASNKIAFEALMNKVREDMTADPMIDRIAKEAGWATEAPKRGLVHAPGRLWNSGKEWAQDIWNHSQNMMWGFHDLMLVSRVRELMAGGLPMKQAIDQAERFIANYRVPATIGEGGKVAVPKPIARGLSRLMQDRSLTVFGRYHYNVLSSLGHVIRDANRALTRSGMSLAERREALGRFSFMAIAATVLPAGLTMALRKATGDKEAHVQTAGAISRAQHLAEGTYKATHGEGNYDFWAALSSIITPMPAGQEAASQLFNKDLFSGQQIAGPHLPAWQQAVERGLHAAERMISPAEEALRMWQHKGVPSLGISTPDPTAVEKGRRFQEHPGPRVLRSERRAFQKALPFGAFKAEPNPPPGSKTKPPP